MGHIECHGTSGCAAAGDSSYEGMYGMHGPCAVGGEYLRCVCNMSAVFRLRSCAVGPLLLSVHYSNVLSYLTVHQANLRMQTCAASDVREQGVDRPTANWMLWNGWGGLEVLTQSNHSCNAFEESHCEVFEYLLATNSTAAALAEKREAAGIYAALNASMPVKILPFIPAANVSKVLAASVEAGAFASAIVAEGWTVMLLGYVGDRTGEYNRTGIRAAIQAYDALWEGYRKLNDTYGAAAPGIYSDRWWSQSKENTPGMGQSVDRYRDL